MAPRGAAVRRDQPAERAAHRPRRADQGRHGAAGGRHAAGRRPVPRRAARLVSRAGGRAHPGTDRTRRPLHRRERVLPRLHVGVSRDPARPHPRGAARDHAPGPRAGGADAHGGRPVRRRLLRARGAREEPPPPGRSLPRAAPRARRHRAPPRSGRVPRARAPAVPREDRGADEGMGPGRRIPVPRHTRPGPEGGVPPRHRRALRPEHVQGAEGPVPARSDGMRGARGRAAARRARGDGGEDVRRPARPARRPGRLRRRPRRDQAPPGPGAANGAERRGGRAPALQRVGDGRPHDRGVLGARRASQRRAAARPRRAASAASRPEAGRRPRAATEC